MRAAFIASPGNVEVREVDTPTLEGGDLLVRVRNCGICGSDLHAYRGDLPPRPYIPCGHEIAGDVEAVAPNVTSFAIGDRVALSANVGCGSCAYCASGEEHLCPQRRFLGLTFAGGMADCVRIPARAAHKLPGGLAYGLAALAEPLAVVVHGLHITGPITDRRVLIFGAGALGLLGIPAARRAGAAEVFSVYRYPHQGEAARSLGADAAFEATDAGLDALRAALGKQPPDLIVETVGGQSDTLGQAIALAKPGGTVLVLGVFNRPQPVSLLSMALKELRVIASQGYCRAGDRPDMDVALEILSERAGQAARLITHRFPLEQAQEALRVAADKGSGSLKVQITFS